jgi:hypothetical protein
MLNRVAKSLMSMLLAATVLAGSIMPPGVRHAHTGGNDRSHQHVGIVTTVLNQQRHDWCAKCGDHCKGCQLNSIFITNQSPGQYATHLHFLCLGFRLTLPDSSRTAKQSTDTSDSQLVNVRTTEYLRPTQQHIFSVEKLFIPLCQESTADGVTAIHAVVPSSQTVTTTLLCDRARHERSGVQLI